MRRVTRTRGKLGRTVALLLVVASGWYAATLPFGNVHAVVDGQLYRSGTLGAGHLEALMRRHGIRTVINLRGMHPELEWYRRERRVVAAAGGRLIDLRWSSKHQLTDEQVSGFFDAVDAAEGPVLIHCQSGADRTSLAAALYLAHVEGVPEEIAEGQLSLRFGHVALPFFRAYQMDETFERLEPALGYSGS